MTQSQEIAAVVAAVGAACAVPGTLLVARRLVMVGDAIGHVLLLGVVVAFLVVKDAESVWLLFGAAAVGVLTVAAVEAVQRTRLVKSDAAVGLVFPALFALGTILASLYLRETHLDVDQVLLGSADLSPQDRLTLFGDFSLPRSLVVLSVCILGWLAAVVLFFKELKLTAFDPAYAGLLGFLPGLVHYATMTGVSLTAVAAFDAAGPILMLAFFAVPPLIARRFTHRLGRVMLLAVAVSISTGIIGTRLALRLDTTVAGTCAAVLGAKWALAELFAPKHGLLADLLRRYRQSREFADRMLLVHLRRHENTPAEADENRADGLHRHLNWPPAEILRVVARCEAAGLLRRDGELLKLTDDGRALPDWGA